MENIFSDIQGTGTSQEITQTSNTVESTNNNIATLGEEFNLDFTPDENSENSTAATEGGTTEQQNQQEITSTTNAEVNNPTNQAFAQMRTQNKEYETKINELDALAKAAGLQGVDDLIAKTKENQIKRTAQSQGIPVEVARQLAEMQEFREQYEQDKEMAAYQAKEQTFVNNLQEFIGANNLSSESVQKLSDNLIKDGFNNDVLMGLPKGALNRILSSYTGANNQKMLERKDNIRNELPLNQTSQVSNDTVLKEIDDIARQFAGK
jgi:hypothetical protein